MKKNIIALISCSLILGWSGCKKDLANDYKDFFAGKEVVYTGSAVGAVLQPGNLRMGLKWKASSDQSIVKYVVYYNNRADSQVVKVDTHTDSVSTVINNLSEYTYSFTIYSYDAKGNKSIPYEVNNAKVYGPIYASTLLNRPFSTSRPYTFTDDGLLQLNFSAPDTINITTVINYTDKNGLAANKQIPANSNSILISDYKVGTPITYNSSYIPVKRALDIFTSPRTDQFPQINPVMQCDKSLFRKATQANDMGIYSGETDVDRLWNGSTTPQPYPNVFHSDDRNTLPRTLTFDMGKIYKKLTSIEEIGRNCCNNPDQFEVWGISDLTNSETTLQPNDAGWKNQALAKGWKLLKEVKRTDDGQAPFKVDFDSGIPPVRYIKIRVLHNANGDNRNVNISQITLWANMLN